MAGAFLAVKGGPAPPTVADVRAAAQRLAGRVIRTPLVENPALNALTGGRVFLKLETLQLTGSFKVRGAFNRLLQLSAAERRRGVVAFSSGNHAQGVAFAARALDLPAIIVMPADAPAVKLEKTRAYGAEVVLYDRHSESREAIAARIAADRGAVVVPSFDDPDIIAGQGTAGLEAAEALRSAGVAPDLVLAPAGGGGLIAGLSLALHDTFPGATILAVEPAGFDDHARSLAAGAILRNASAAGSISDALLAPQPGDLTFAINRVHLAGGIAVTDDETLAAVAFAATELKLVVEPGGAVALAAFLGGKIDARGKVVLVVLSGANIDPVLLAEALRAGFERDPNKTRPNH